MIIIIKESSVMSIATEALFDFSDVIIIVIVVITIIVIIIVIIIKEVDEGKIGEWMRTSEQVQTLLQVKQVA